MQTHRSSRPAFRSFLSFSPPKSSDRAQVQSKEARLPDLPPISLDDQDVEIIKQILVGLLQALCKASMFGLEMEKMLQSMKKDLELLGKDKNEMKQQLEAVSKKLKVQQDVLETLIGQQKLLMTRVASDNKKDESSKDESKSNGGIEEVGLQTKDLELVDYVIKRLSCT
ncbi:hypothetical protein FNV43_RR14273 [Rhamnella rubrinervis]|uniref:Uncharacterized protein n=1 Tax=Rhamnella rubrinervis TaxID=2594499 RepID=A0A8K0H2L4_9ROSA|nr:hypothetical protein FNV43_RR14273 [Rhamnella rubrinervis]